MDEDDVNGGNDVTGDFTAEDIMNSMANIARYRDVKVQPHPRTPVSSKHLQKKPPVSNCKPGLQTGENIAEVSHNISSNRRQQRLRNKATRNSEKSTPTKKKLDDNVTPPSPLITRIRERLNSSNSGNPHIHGNAHCPSPSIGRTAESLSQKTSKPVATIVSDEYQQQRLTKSSSASAALNNYFSKAKEGIKAVASLRSNKLTDNISSGNSKGRQSRSTAVGSADSRRYRSASAGPNVNKSARSNKSPVDAADSTTDPLMSPRTQLKHVRQNLKKVNITPSYSYTRRYASADDRTKNKSSAFSVIPPENSKESDSRKKAESPADFTPTGQVDTENKEEKLNLSKKPPLKPRPQNNLDSTSMAETDRIQTSNPRGNVRKRSESSSARIDVGCADVENKDPASSKRNGVQRNNSSRLKRTSWDFTNEMDTTTQATVVSRLHDEMTI